MAKGAALRSGLLVGCLVATVLAGCLGAPQPGSEALEANEDAPQGGAASGDASGAPAAAASPEAPADAPAPVPVETPLSYEGMTDAGGCAFAAVAGRCAFAGTGQNGFYELPIDGTALRLVAELTSESPTRFGVFLMHQDGDGWVANCDEDPCVGGSAPLALDFDLAKYGGTKLALSVSGLQWAGAAVVFAGAEAPASFAVEGTLTSLPAP